MRKLIKALVSKMLEPLIPIIVKKIENYNTSKIALNQNINIGDKCYISPSAKIDTKYGGKIIIGNNVEIWDGVIIYSYGGIIKIGDNCSINPYTIIYGHGNTEIGNDVLIAGHCMIIPANHIFTNPNFTINSQGCSKVGIKIENNVWIAHGCSVLDGVTIAQGSVIAAGSVINKDVDSFSVYGGIPAKKIKSIK